MHPKLVIVTTAAISADVLLRGQLSYLNESLDVSVITSPGPEIPRVQAREGIRIFSIPMKRSPAPVQDAVSLFRLTRLLRRLKPDIVHAYTPKAGLLGLLAANLARVPIRVRSVNGLPLMQASGMKRKALVWLERLSFWAATDVLANSEGLRSFIRSEIWHGDVGMIGNGSTNGVDTKHYCRRLADRPSHNSTRSQLGIAPDSLVVLYIGRMVRDKGVQELVKAFALLRAMQPRAVLVLVGPRELGDQIDEETTSLIINSPDIIERGFEEDVRIYLEIADILVLPSYREGLPNVLLQGACYKLPLVATDIPGNTDIITDGTTGLLIPSGDADRLVDAIDRLASSPELRQRLGEAAFDSVSRRYGQEEHWLAVLAWYESRLQGMYSK
jgi:glycosyltransferase involved in cell wall biosynthesis